MWDLRYARPFGRLSVRSILMFALATLAACLLYIFVAAPQAHAEAAQWQDGNIVYQSNTYSEVDTSSSKGLNLPQGSQVYMYIEGSTSTQNAQPGKAYVIYFAPGVSPPDATEAQYRVYDFTPPNRFANGHDNAKIEITPSAEATSDGTDSCKLSFNGLAWIICPVTKMLAGATDWAFGVLSDFMAVRPVQTTTNNALYRAWSYMRTFANVAFVIAFMIIIYSQITSMGVSNYGIKKLLPRLVIAAVLVNVSYWICAIAVDVSNILGYSVQDLFIFIRNHLVGVEGNSWENIGWNSVVDMIMAGTAGSAVLGAGIYLSISGAGLGAAYMLIPILLGVATAILVALIILAARQAIITILIILSPIAFVAFLLPNTEKYFGKWRELFMTMLVLFPLFSVIFGGSQLAGAAVIQNANSITTVLFGMAIQVIPLVITPLLIRFSGGLLGRVAGMINNPNRGLIDRSRKFAEGMRDNHKANRMRKNNANLPKNIKAGRKWRASYNSLALSRNRLSRRMENNRRANDAYNDATWENDPLGHKSRMLTYEAADLKERGTTASQAAYERLKHTDSRIQELDHTIRANKLKLDVSKAKVEANWEELRAGNIDSVIQPAELSGDALKNYLRERQIMAYNIQADTLASRVEERRAHEAKEVQSTDYAHELLVNDAMRKRAGGINKHGADSVLANAIAQERKTYVDNVNDKIQLIKHFNLSSTDRQKLALGESVTGERVGDDGKVTYFKFDSNDDFSREAAIDQQLITGSARQIERIIDESAEVTYVRDSDGIPVRNADGTIKTRAGITSKYRTSISDAVPKNSIPNKIGYTGSKSIDDISQGTYNREEATIYTVSEGKIKDNALAGMDSGAIKTLFRDDLEQWIDPNDTERLTKFRAQRQNMINSVHRILSNPTIAQSLSDSSRDVLVDIRNRTHTD